MSTQYFFGYGSLVNRQTHSYDHAQPARVHGWRRRWRHTNLRAVAYLTVCPAPGHFIDGVIAAVPNGDWAALDEREHAYDRAQLPPSAIDHRRGALISVEMYHTKPGNTSPPSVRHPILQSYLDTVLLGYFDVFGSDGIDHFFATTDGWDAPVIQDREAPIYPRTQAPDASMRSTIDRRMDALGIRRLPVTP